MHIKGVVQRGENTYRFTVSVGFDGNGKNIRKTMTYKVPEGTAPSKAEKLVMAAYADFARRCKDSRELDENMRFKELVDIYLKEYAVNELKAVTRETYKCDLDVHLLPIFGNKKICDITTKSLTRYFTGLNKASETTRKLKTVMSSIFSYGVRQGYIQKNPCRGALYRKDTTKVKKVKYLDKEQCRKLVAATSEYSTVNTIIQFLLFTGLRVGECLGLGWKDIDFENGTVTVRNTLSYANKHWFLSTPKTATSHRTLKLSSYTKALLLTHKAKQDELKAVVGEAWVNPDVVFTSAIGEFYDRDTVNRQLKKILTANGMPPLTVHSLRHTNASLMINSGVNIKAVSSHLGHCNISITCDTYSHMFEEYEARIANALEENLL